MSIIKRHVLQKGGDFNGRLHKVKSLENFDFNVDYPVIKFSKSENHLPNNCRVYTIIYNGYKRGILDVEVVRGQTEIGHRLVKSSMYNYGGGYGHFTESNPKIQIGMLLPKYVTFDTENIIEDKTRVCSEDSSGYKKKFQETFADTKILKPKNSLYNNGKLMFVSKIYVNGFAEGYLFIMRTANMSENGSSFSYYPESFTFSYHINYIQTKSQLNDMPRLTNKLTFNIHIKPHKALMLDLQFMIEIGQQYVSHFYNHLYKRSRLTYASTEYKEENDLHFINRIARDSTIKYFNRIFELGHGIDRNSKLFKN